MYKLTHMPCLRLVTRRSFDSLFLSRYRACCPYDVLRAVILVDHTRITVR